MNKPDFNELSDQTKPRVKPNTIRQRWDKGERDMKKLLAQPMSRSAGARKGKKNSYFGMGRGRDSIK